MLKMYQISQAEMVRGLSIFIEDRLLMLSLIIFAVVMIFVVSFIYWLAKIVRKGNGKHLWLCPFISYCYYQII